MIILIRKHVLNLGKEVPSTRSAQQEQVSCLSFVLFVMNKGTLKKNVKGIQEEFSSNGVKCRICQEEGLMMVVILK